MENNNDNDIDRQYENCMAMKAHFAYINSLIATLPRKKSEEEERMQREKEEAERNEIEEIEEKWRLEHLNCEKQNCWYCEFQIYSLRKKLKSLKKIA